ncbi:MAG: membrane protein insertion efficiency factor YidD [Prolixibacteraceae bacterium]|jgi:putative membrane protein insertion efficiency factor|nr:membrane protein insertion efficiency factor YidD [Prolixibacteraceae bacterium]
MSFKKQITKILSYPLLGVVYFYKYAISPLSPASCRHVPTCSSYMIEAIKIHGLKGFWMGLRRLSKCHPWGTHGYDPVPPKNYIKTQKMNTKKLKKKN